MISTGTFSKLMLPVHEMGVIMMFYLFFSILSISSIRFNDMNRRVALLVHLLLPEEQEVHWIFNSPCDFLSWLIITIYLYVDCQNTLEWICIECANKSTLRAWNCTQYKRQKLNVTKFSSLPIILGSFEDIQDPLRIVKDLWRFLTISKDLLGSLRIFKRPSRISKNLWGSSRPSSRCFLGRSLRIFKDLQRFFWIFKDLWGFLRNNDLWGSLKIFEDLQGSLRIFEHL